VIYKPYIEQAPHVAEFPQPENQVDSYPAPKTRSGDRPVKDRGNNFGPMAGISGLTELTLSLVVA